MTDKKTIEFRKAGKLVEVEKHQEGFAHQKYFSVTWGDEKTTGYLDHISGVLHFSGPRMKHPRTGEYVDGFSLDDDTCKKLEQFKEEMREVYEKQLEEATREDTQIKIEEISWRHGKKKVLSIVDSSTLDSDEREMLQKIERISGRERISGAGIDHISAICLLENTEANLDETYTVRELYEMCKDEIEKHEQERNKKKENEEEKRQQLFKKAKETGEKQLIDSHMTSCNDVNEECNTDMIYEYAMPDGSVQNKRCHTW